MNRVGIVLSGGGFLHSSEAHEAVLTLRSLEHAGATVVCFAPEEIQLAVINNITGEEITGFRRVFNESANLVKGAVLPLSIADPARLDALIIPAGTDTIKILSGVASNTAKNWVDADLTQLTREMHKQGKPIGCVGVASTLIPLMLGQGIRLTLGNDPDSAELIDALGAEHVVCPANDVVIDFERQIISTPGYLHTDDITLVTAGIDKLVARILSWSA
ncbi:isoprenoid biosynthesis glyoxalase ElbB [Edaphovirga cremea]|uniref:isoprenoid biosynthesis glyoxalase ElbB n=1 Tax=Edaphovirga cremea TaxID=2267246 RepID=UPI000DEED4B9|nr:isoprenoid biosynthesis glyoxalase ElbB [Edaphovirga cremea]